MIVPASSTHTSDSMASRPVSRSMDTSVTTAPKLQTSRSAWKYVAASSPGVSPAGSAAPPV